MNNKSHLKISLVIKIISVLASIYGMVTTIDSVKAFTYFTILSNIFIDVALLLFIIKDIKLLKGQQVVKSNRLYTIKFLATISITLTFLVFLLILAPTAKGGILQAYFGELAGSFGVHFLGPILAIIDFLLFDYGYESHKHHAVFAIIPPVIYVCYVFILSLFGVRWAEGMKAPYNFINYGAETGWFGFDLSKLCFTTLGIGVAYMIVALAGLFLLIGSLFLLIKNLRRKKYVK